MAGYFTASDFRTWTKARFKGAYLVVNRICNIPQMEGEDEDHRIRQCSATSNVLLASHTDVEEGPKDQTRPEFIK